MFGGLALAFLVVPFLELFVLLKVGQSVGVIPTIVMLVVVSIVGASLVKREGFAVLRRIQERIAQGAVPGTELVDGFLIMLAGALLLTPGFLTDFVAVGLLIPPVRALARAGAVRFMRKRAHLVQVRDLGDVIDVWSSETPGPPERRGGSGPWAAPDDDPPRELR